MRCGRALWHIARSGGPRRRPVTRITWPTTALAIVARVLPAAVIFALFVSGLLIRGGANLTVISGLGVFGMCAVVIMAGDRILDWSGAPQSVGGGTMAVIVGTASTSIFIVATYFVFGILALNAFLFWSVLVLGAIVLDVGANLRTSDWRLDTRDGGASAGVERLLHSRRCGFADRQSLRRRLRSHWLGGRAPRGLSLRVSGSVCGVGRLFGFSQPRHRDGDR